MKIERLKKDNHKLVIGGLIIACILIFVITYTATRAKYQNTEIIPLVNGVVNYKAYDFKVMAMYQQKEDSDCTEDSCYNAITGRMPGSEYVINESKSYCTLDNKAHDTEAVLKTVDGNHVISNLKKNDKCYLWFDKVLTVDDIIARLNIKSGTPDFSTIATGAETVANNGVYKTADPMYGENAESYYWRGAVTNNYVKFGNFCWRIIRINGDGSIRMIYDGTSCHANGTITTESIAKTDVYYATSDGKHDNSSYVGWTYELGSQRALSGTSSYAKQQLETWYANESGFTSAQKKKIADGKFCNDRNVGETYSGWDLSRTWSTTWSATGTQFAYAAVDRVWNKYQPLLVCDSGDTYTLKVGLITADEVELAGGKNENNNQYYLYNGQDYWTMSPVGWSGGHAGVFFVDASGNLNPSYTSVNLALGLRPVINLIPDTVFASGGTGAYNAPYVVI